MAKAKTNPTDSGTGQDVTVSKDSSLTVLNWIRECKKEATEAKKRRTQLNRQNMRAYMGQQDWSHKQTGQSREFLPKTPVAVEQFSAFVKRALIQFGNWFSVDSPKTNPLSSDEIREFVKYHLNYLADGMRDWTTFPLRVSDGVKLALLESLITFKIHGYRVPETRFFAERGTKFMQSGDDRVLVKDHKLIRKTLSPWRLAIDLIRAEDYYPDPTGRKLYEIHHVERDLHDVIELAEQGIYDASIVEQIAEDFDDRQREYEINILRNQPEVVSPSFRKTVGIDEAWGDILDEMGHVVGRNQICAMANDKFLIRKPEDNPWWHGDSPFVSFPLIRVPDTVWHKALFDHASPLNLALNELFNLMLDGGLASVWGIKQLRMSGLQDPRQVSGGVAQGMTLTVKDDFPQGEKVLENVTTGQIPQEAMAIFGLGDREFNSSALTNELKLGSLPAKEVRATEIVEIQQSQAVTLDGITIDMELGLTKTIEKAWFCILQNTDDLDGDEIVAAIGPKAALMLSRMSSPERYAAFARGASFKVNGLSGTLAKVKDFQKFVATMQIVQSNPLLAEPFIRRFSGDKALEHILKSLNVNPDDLGLSPEEMKDVPNRVNRMAAISQVFGANGSSPNMSADQSGGSASLPAQVNQTSNPLTGMGGA